MKKIDTENFDFSVYPEKLRSRFRIVKIKKGICVRYQVQEKGFFGWFGALPSDSSLVAAKESLIFILTKNCPETIEEIKID